MKIFTVAAVVLLAGSPAIVHAQSCASPLAMPSDMVVTGSTCTGNAGLSMGGATIPHQYIVYEFTYQDDAGAGAEPDAIVVDSTADINAIVATSCTDAPVGGAAVGIDYSVEGLTEGQNYVVVVTTDPSIPVGASGPVCDDFQLTVNTLPVELQGFSAN